MSRRKTQMPSVKSVLGIRPTDKPPPPEFLPSPPPAICMLYYSSVLGMIRFYL